MWKLWQRRRPRLSCRPLVVRPANGRVVVRPILQNFEARRGPMFAVAFRLQPSSLTLRQCIYEAFGATVGVIRYSTDHRVAPDRCLNTCWGIVALPPRRHRSRFRDFMREWRMPGRIRSRRAGSFLWWRIRRLLRYVFVRRLAVALFACTCRTTDQQYDKICACLHRHKPDRWLWEWQQMPEGYRWF